MTTLEGNELRRAVAEALGWRMVGSGATRELFKPGGKGWIVRYPHAEYTLQQAWDDAYSLHDIIPDYPTDLNTIKDAPLDEDVSLEICNPLPYDTKRMWDVSLNTETGERYDASHPEPATAFWNAWLMMRNAARNG